MSTPAIILLILLGAVIIGGVFFSRRKEKEMPEEVVEGFISAIEDVQDGNYEEITNEDEETERHLGDDYGKFWEDEEEDIDYDCVSMWSLIKGILALGIVICVGMTMLSIMADVTRINAGSSFNTSTPLITAFESFGNISWLFPLIFVGITLIMVYRLFFSFVQDSNI